MKIKELLVERILNLITDQEKNKYLDQVWDIIQLSYAPIGGFYTAETPQELINKFYLWKIVVRDGHVTAAKIEKAIAGRKTVGIATDGSIQGKRDIRMLMKADVVTQRGWIECSGKPEIIYRAMGAPPIPNIYAEIILKRPIVSYNSDGYHYTRIFDNHLSEEIMFGYAKITPEDINKLQEQGIETYDLPSNIFVVP